MSEFRVAHRRIMNMLARGVLEEAADDEAGVQQNQVSLLRDEAKVKVERFQNYGYSSSPPLDTEVLCVFLGGGRDHGVVIGTDHRGARFTGLKAGEVAIYTDEGDSIVFNRDNSITLTCGKQWTIKVKEKIETETKESTLKAEDKVAIETKESTLKADTHGIEANVNIKGNITVDGNIQVSGNINATGSINAPHGSVGP